MEVLIRNAEGNLRDSDKDYAAQKLGNLDHYFSKAQRVEIVHRKDKRQHKEVHRIEVTVHADGLLVRSEETDASIHAAIDKVADKLTNRLRRLKGRLIDSHRKKGHSIPVNLEPEEEKIPDFQISEKKQFLLKPATYEEAALQMEMIDHPFYIFLSEETGNVELLYRRKDGEYGLIQPEK